MLDEVDVLPIIHACPLQMLVIDLKTEWVDEVQTRTDRQACSSDVSCVVGNQRGAENNVQAFKLEPIMACLNGLSSCRTLGEEISRAIMESSFKFGRSINLLRVS